MGNKETEYLQKELQQAICERIFNLLEVLQARFSRKCTYRKICFCKDKRQHKIKPK